MSLTFIKLITILIKFMFVFSVQEAVSPGRERWNPAARTFV